jgi:hypothetical protein
MAIRIIVSRVWVKYSSSVDKRRSRFSQAKVRSTIQPLGSPGNPFQALEPFDHLDPDVAPGPQGPHPSRQITSLGLSGPHQPEPGTPVTEDL